MGVVPGGYAVNHYLTDTDAWFLMTDVPNGFKHFVICVEIMKSVF